MYLLFRGFTVLASYPALFPVFQLKNGKVWSIWWCKNDVTWWTDLVVVRTTWLRRACYPRTLLIIIHIVMVGHAWATFKLALSAFLRFIRRLRFMDFDYKILDCWSWRGDDRWLCYVGVLSQVSTSTYMRHSMANYSYMACTCMCNQWCLHFCVYAAIVQLKFKFWCQSFLACLS